MCGRVPIMRERDALIVGVVNIFCPGAGALIAAAKEDFKGDLVCLGIAQFVLCFIIIGWIWAIIWGLRVISKGTPDGAPVGASPAAAAAAAATGGAGAAHHSGAAQADVGKIPAAVHAQGHPGGQPQAGEPYDQNVPHGAYNTNQNAGYNANHAPDLPPGYPAPAPGQPGPGGHAGQPHMPPPPPPAYAP
jgi:hypothetical protein